MILENLLAAIQANTAALQANTAARGNAAVGVVNPAAPAPAQADPLALPAAQPLPTGITADSITALIQPHVGNEAIKSELGAAMRGLGINALPETQPHQFAPLYQKFQEIINKYTGGGAAPSSASII